MDVKKITFYRDLNNSGSFDNEPIVDTVTICNGADGADGISVGVQTTSLTAGCRILTFFKDINLNGLKEDNEEVISTTNICNGENGISIKAIATTVTDCINGGVTYSFYGDINNNNVLDENESVINEIEICNGADGADGADGANGADGAGGGSLIGISINSASSVQCENPAGGLVFELFSDTDLDGIKDSGEVIFSTNVVCNDFTPIILASNGVTLQAVLGTKAGQSYDYQGTSYKVVDNNGLSNALTDGDDLSKIITTKVTNMRNMFN